MVVQPKNDWVLLRCEPFVEKKGSIFVLAHHQRVRHGEVLAVGPGRYKYGTDQRIPMDVTVGERVAFFRENMEHQQGKAIKDVLIELGDDLALIKVDDILGGVGRDTVIDT